MRLPRPSFVFNFLPVHISGRANSAAEFLSRMHTDPSLSLQIKLKDHVLTLEIETEAKAPVVSLSNIVEVTQFSDDLPNVVVKQFINQLKAHGFYDDFLAKTPLGQPDIPITGLFSST